MKNKIVISLLSVTIIIVVIVFFVLDGKEGNEQNVDNNSILSGQINTSTEKGIVTKNENGSNEYVNTEIGLSFSLSPNWTITRDDLPVGVLQLFNYTDDGTYKKGFGTGENKIEAMLVSSTETGESSDYPEKNRARREVLVNNQKVVVYDIELERGDIYRSYIISLPTTPDKYLSITIYGDTSNFQELDEIVESYATIEK